MYSGVVLKFIFVLLLVFYILRCFGNFILEEDFFLVGYE